MAERRQPHRCWELVLASPSAAQCAVLEQKGCDPEIAKRFVLKHLDGGGIYVFIGLTRQLRMNQVLDTVLDAPGWSAANFDPKKFADLAAGCGPDDLVRDDAQQGARTDLRTHVAAVPPSVVPGTVRVLPPPPTWAGHKCRFIILLGLGMAANDAQSVHPFVIVCYILLECVTAFLTNGPLGSVTSPRLQSSCSARNVPSF